VDGWLNGLIPYALSVGDVAGAVVVVKDGQILTQRGFGLADVKSRKPVDPERTLFRPGSVSKLFTWTAVMKQVEAGKLDPPAPAERPRLGAG
jgi:CubicO group peptidase (beta-lactamase class C family)